MLSLALVLIVGLGSVGLYLTAYVYPEIHRKTDIWWSGTGLFYALILLIYRRPIGLLLGHTASVVLLVWLSYQALQRRWAMVEANPPQPEAGSWGAQARAIADQVVAKMTSVDWQGLWARMGTQAKDGTSEKSILPPAIKQRLDLSGLGEKLKGMISGKETADVGSTAETVQPVEISAPVVDSSAATTTDPTIEATAQPAPGTEPTSPVEDTIAETPQIEDLTVEAKTTPEIEQPAPSSDTPTESATKPEEATEPAIKVESAVEAQTPEQTGTQKAELEAELDQVISDLSPEGQETPPNLPQPPDPLG